MFIEITDANDDLILFINLSQVKYIVKTSKGTALFNFNGEGYGDNCIESAESYDEIISGIKSHNKNQIVLY